MVNIQGIFHVNKKKILPIRKNGKNIKRHFTEEE